MESTTTTPPRQLNLRQEDRALRALSVMLTTSFVLFSASLVARVMFPMLPLVAAIFDTVAIALLLITATGVVARARAGWARSLFAAIVLFAALVLALVNTDLTVTGFRTLLLSFLGLAVAVLTAKLNPNPILIGLRTYVLASGILLLSPLSAVMYSTTAARDGSFSLLGDYRLQGLLVSPNTNGAVIATYLVLELAHLTRYGRRNVWLRALVLVVAIVQLAQTGSNTAILAATASIVVMSLPWGPVRTIVALGALGYAFFPSVVVASSFFGGDRTRLFDPTLATGRGYVWQRAGTLILESPFGAPARLTLPSEPGNALDAYGGGHAHNQGLQLWLLGGWLLVLLTAALILALVIKARGNKYVTAAVVAGALLSYSEVPFLWLPGSVNVLIVVGLISLASYDSSDRRID